MSKTIFKFLLPLLMLSVAIPESEAKRMGGGRSTGRQAQGIKKTAPPAGARTVQPERMQRSQTPPPAAARQPDERIARPQPVPQAPPPASAPTPAQTLPRQAASPWGGMLGGALLGLGLGSLMSRDGNAADQANQANQANQQAGSSGSGESGSGASGTSGASGDYADAPARQAPQEAKPQTAGIFGTMLPLALLAFVIYFAVRRMRRRNR
ncbi:hypothetical protein [Noviherbaspirillum aerium]|uniref:hypothetical protein n=1 Tax=Noviherbaspirillum aerium TaxID=2588497 RepID=UPI00178C6E62|nr:hypothetical protein [Noviherbaspirillum aerium]